MPDRIWGADALMAPLQHLFSITPSDSTDLTDATRGIYIGGAGDLVVDLVGSGTSVSLTGLTAGQFHPIRIKRVRATGTTATGIVGGY